MSESTILEITASKIRSKIKPHSKQIEDVRNKLDSNSLGSVQSYNVSNVNFDSFLGWAETAKHVNDPDIARNVFYFGFQPLYDCLIEDNNLRNNRDEAVSALDRMIDVGTQYLTGYYTGEPKIEFIKNLGNELIEVMKKINEARFRTKFRNVDYNGIYPKHIQSFLRQFIDYFIDGNSTKVDYVVGCACGSSEIVMPLAGAIGSGLGFMRRSYRRGDDFPKIVPEHQEKIQTYIEGKFVVCVEDYVCSGRSLRKVMEHTAGFKPKNIIGASINGNSGTCSSELRIIHSEHKFHLYETK